MRSVVFVSRRTYVPRPGCWLFALSLLALPGLRPAAAQPAAEARADRPQVGLVLGGGGAKGLAHVGVLKALEDIGLPVDVVTGTSMGSIVGGLYAIGNTPAHIESVSVSLDWNELFSDASPRLDRLLEQRRREERYLLSLPIRKRSIGLPAGLLAGQKVEMLLTELMLPAYDVRDFRALPVPFAAVATDLETGEGVRLDGGYLPKVIRASMSLPSIFTPVTIDGRTYVDGGVARNLPAEDALALGADVLVCVDVGAGLLPAEELTSMLAIMSQAVGFRMDESTRQQRQLCDVLIFPDIDGISTLDFGRAGDMVERGEKATHAFRERIEAIRDSIGVGVGASPGQPRATRQVVDSVWVQSIELVGVVGSQERQVRQLLSLSVPGYLYINTIARAVERVYGTQQFSQVSYQLEPEAEQARLVVTCSPRDPGRLAVGLRYDSQYRASLLFNLQLNRQRGSGSSFEATMRLGEVFVLDGEYSRPLRLRPRLGLRLGGAASRTPLDIFEDGARVSILNADVFELRGGFLSALYNRLGVGIRLRGELYNLDPRVIDQSSGEAIRDLLDEAAGLVQAEGILFADTYDREGYPSRGAQWYARAALSPGFFGNSAFGQYVFAGQVRQPLSSRLSLLGRLIAGTTYGSDIPPHHLLFLGGAFPYEVFFGRQYMLLGYDAFEIPGKAIQAVGVGAQYEVMKSLFVDVQWNAGSAMNRWDWTPNASAFQGGFGIGVGTPTVLGPVQLKLTTRALDGPYELLINVGHIF